MPFFLGCKWLHIQQSSPCQTIILAALRILHLGGPCKKLDFLTILQQKDAGLDLGPPSPVRIIKSLKHQIKSAMKLQVPNNQKTTIYNARLSFLYNTFCYTLKEVRKSLRSLLNCHSNYIQQYLITCPLNRTEMQKIAKSIIFINNFSGFKSHE